jgi:small subunit ribosomal protein S17
MSEAQEVNVRRRKSLAGLVVSDKMDKTIVVQIDRMVMHPAYKKFVKKRVTYKVHDELNNANVGDTVLIEECRPLSKQKRWRMKSVATRAV